MATGTTLEQSVAAKEQGRIEPVGRSGRITVSESPQKCVALTTKDVSSVRWTRGAPSGPGTDPTSTHVSPSSNRATVSFIGFSWLGIASSGGSGRIPAAGAPGGGIIKKERRLFQAAAPPEEKTRGY